LLGVAGMMKLLVIMDPSLCLISFGQSHMFGSL
jgi:hypothetical protein